MADIRFYIWCMAAATVHGFHKIQIVFKSSFLIMISYRAEVPMELCVRLALLFKSYSILSVWSLKLEKSFSRGKNPAF
jgi:hypothetical protein